MEDGSLIAGLIRKKAEITAQVEALQRQLRQLIMDADSIDGAICIPNPAIDLTDTRPRTVPRSHVAFLGEVRRTTLNMLRETGLALTIKDIAFRVMTERKLSVSDVRLVRLIEKVGSGLRRLRRRGSVQSEKDRGRSLRWTLVQAEGG